MNDQLAIERFLLSSTNANIHRTGSLRCLTSFEHQQVRGRHGAVAYRDYHEAKMTIFFVFIISDQKNLLNFHKRALRW